MGKGKIGGSTVLGGQNGCRPFRDEAATQIIKCWLDLSRWASSLASATLFPQPKIETIAVALFRSIRTNYERYGMITVLMIRAVDMVGGKL